MTAADGAHRCVKLRAGFVFADAQCTEEAGKSVAQFVAKYLRGTDGTGCAQIGRMYAAGDQIPNDQLFQRQGARCVPYTNTDPVTVKYHRRGDEVPPEQMALFREAAAPPGRVQRRFFVSDDGLAKADALWDTQSGQRCTFVRTSKGWRCLPSEIANPFFADATCTMLAAYITVGQPICGVSPTDQLASIQSGPWCRPRFTAARWGAQIGSAFTRSSDGSCVAMPLTGRPARVLTPLDPDGFERADLVIE